MIVKLKVHGTGTPNDPVHGGVPTGSELFTLLDEGVTYWQIPDETHPELHAHPSAKLTRTTHGIALIGLDKAGHAAWHAHLDERYREHKGKFRPEIAQ